MAAEGRQQRLASNFYVRWDGTRAFYFEEASLPSPGCSCSIVVHEPSMLRRCVEGLRFAVAPAGSQQPSTMPPSPC